MDMFFEKTSENFGDFRISTICLDNLSKNGCRHWIVYKDGKNDQLCRSKIIDLFLLKGIPLSCHYKNDKDDKNDHKKCIIS